jgi:hypothetical protein
MAEDRIMMRNPNTGRDDMRIDRAIFEPVRDAILAALAEEGELSNPEMHEEIERRTPADLWSERSLLWYATSVKLHLEAEGTIIVKGSPQKLTLP